MPLIKCELRNVPNHVVRANFADLIRPGTALNNSIHVYSIFNPETESFSSGAVCFSASTRNSRDRHQAINYSLPRHQPTVRLTYHPALLEDISTHEQQDEGFSSGFRLGDWTAPGSLPYMFRRQQRRGISILDDLVLQGAVAVPQSGLSATRERAPTPPPSETYAEYMQRRQAELAARVSSEGVSAASSLGQSGNSSGTSTSPFDVSS